LGKINVYRFVLGYFLVVWIGDLHRTVLSANPAASALIFFDVSRFLGQRDVKVPCLAFDLVHLGIGQDFNIWMPADLDQFGGKNSH
jgi:hypothetical protein